MRRRDLLIAPLAPLAPAAGAKPTQRIWRERALIGFGTTLSIRAAHADPERLEQALAATVAVLRDVERETSLFVTDGHLSTLNRDGVIERPGRHLLAVLQAARRVSAASEGAFDVTLQPLWAAWDDAHRRGELPATGELRQARERVGWRHVLASSAEVRLQRPGSAVTLNGIAQGYAADCARAVLRAHGVEHALVNAGEWTSLGASPDGGPWRLGLADPRASDRVLALLRADGRAVACSSDAHYAFSDDRKHHHIIDPRSGHSPTQIAAVAVVAPSAMLADALTKVLFMGNAHAALAAAHRFGVDAIVVDKAGRISASPGLPLA